MTNDRVKNQSGTNFQLEREASRPNKEVAGKTQQRKIIEEKYVLQLNYQGPSNFATREIAKILRTQENCEKHVFKYN